MKLSKKDRYELECILSQLKTAKAFLDSPRTVICVESGCAAGNDGFVNPSGKSVVAIEKECGSNYCHLGSAVNKLNRLLNPPVVGNA